MAEKLKNYKIILGSQSTRRKELLKNLGLTFDTVTIDIDEDYPKYLHGNEITSYLAKLKADTYSEVLADNEMLITADTIVRAAGKVLGKPKDSAEAKQMLLFLSERLHEVITSICIKTKDKSIIINDTTAVHFKKLTEEEIDYYITKYKPYDKAGAYGIQEWIGYIAVNKIEGSFYTVMGFPVHKFYKEMMEFTS
ncbi:septum formation protein Maf [Aureibaculum marinum]|uniref:dTTP/UTP pyrophosphatase n=1 Tax=Aureibaculum marinum TaxID=2487930 RepID=A0A3N4NJE2_9FLAO|nr:septum formation protein Maf [Aureibaculum marinum]